MVNVIYIPGLGDNKITFQRLAVRTWRLWGVRPHVFHMKWEDDELYDVKFERLLDFIAKLRISGPIAIVAASAGATVAINAYASRPDDICSVVLIAGKVNNPNSIGEGYRRRAPAFWASAQQTTNSLGMLSANQRSNILSLRAMVDMIVPAKDSTVTGAQNKVVWTSGHAFTIAWQLVFGAPRYLRFIKQKINHSF